MNRIAIIAVAAALIVAGGAGWVLYNDQSIPDDGAEYLGVFEGYTYEPTLVFTGDQAEHISWDFGDGTPVLCSRDSGSDDGSVVEAYHRLLSEHGGNVWAPTHRFAEPGDYEVVQTVWNPYDPDGTGLEQTASGVFLVRILGHPTITLMSEGEVVDRIEVPKNGPGDDPRYAPNVAERPADPERDGFAFEGWYYDDGSGNEFDWSAPVSEHVTLHARWAASGSAAIPDLGTGSDGFIESLGDDAGLAASVSVSAIGVLGMLFFVRRRGMAFAAAFAAIAMIAGLSAFAEFNGSDLIGWFSDAIDGLLDADGAGSADADGWGEIVEE